MSSSTKSLELNYVMRVGLIPRLGTELPADPVEWAMGQLNAVNTPLKSPATVSTLPVPDYREWPTDFDPGLKERLINLWRWDEAREKIRKEYSHDRRAQQQKLDEAQFKYDLRWQDAAKFNHYGAYSDNSVKQRLAHFWFNHFTVGSYDAFYTAGDMYENRILKNLDGTFADLLYEATTHYSMLRYLDNIVNISPNSEQGRNRRQKGKQVGLNDNLAREVMELHSCSPAQGYTEDDIHNAARVLAGWGDYNYNPRWAPQDWKSAEYPYISKRSDTGTKVILGKTYGRGSSALKEFTNDLANLDNTRKHICYKLALHFISDEPSNYVTDALESSWRSSNGSLAQVHQRLIELAWTHGERKVLWPSHWLFNIVRASNAHYFEGYEDILSWQSGRDVVKPLTELGNSFWQERQPNGFPLQSREWISLEHLDRRVRFAQSVWNQGLVQASSDQIMDHLKIPLKARLQKRPGAIGSDEFVRLTVNQWMMEVQA